MARVILEISAPGFSRTELQSCEGPQVRIGRAFDNDVILTDRFVSPHHALLEAQDDGWIVRDLNSKNGIYLVPGKKAPQEVFLRSGDTFWLGRVQVRVFAPDHAVPPARSLSQGQGLLQTLNRKRTTALALVGVLFVFMHEEYLHTVEASSIAKLAVWSFWLFLPFLIWTGFWTLISRVVKHRPRFFMHLTLTAAFCIFAVPVLNMVNLAGYLSSSLFVAMISSGVFFGLLFTLLFMGHLAIATNMSSGSRVFFSVFITVLILGIAGLTYSSTRDDFYPDPRPYGVLKPPLIKVVPSRPIEQFLGICRETMSRAQKKS